MPVFATFYTSYGSFSCRLFDKEASQAVGCFCSYAEATFGKGMKHRDPRRADVVFHRIVQDLFIQSSLPATKLYKPDLKQTYCSPHRFLKPGMLAMVGRKPYEKGFQFFLTVNRADWFYDNHVAFGEIVNGLEVLHSISILPTDILDKPVYPVVLFDIDIDFRGDMNDMRFTH